MFGRKKDAAKISDRTPVFHVRYIGCTETFVATGTGCSYVPVQRLWDNSPAHRDMRKVAIHISPQGLSLQDMNEKPTTPTPPPPPPPQQQQQQQQQQQYPYYNNQNSHQHHQQQQQQQQQRPLSQHFAIENIAFCNVDRAVNERIFSWIFSHRDRGSSGQQRPARLDCHAVLCSTAQKAQTMAIVLSRAFQIAYKDWKAHHRSSSLPLNRFPSSASSSSSGHENDKTRNNVSSTPPPSLPSVTSKTTSSVTSSSERAGWGTPWMTAPAADDKTSASLFPALSQAESTPLPPPAPFSDDVTGDAAPKSVTSSVSVQQVPASSYFVSSHIVWDPELEAMVGEVDSLHADMDLEEGSESD